MPRTYTRRFRVRWTDCDASGYVSHVAFLCYTQEMGFEAGTDAGYGLPWWTEVGVGWLARRSHIEYFQPVRYGDELDATTYLASFSRIRAQRNYDFVRGDATLVAQAEIDWVLFDRRSGAPARLNADVMRAFRSEGPEPDAQSRPLDATPLPDSSPPGAYRTSRRVYYADIDEYQHVNNAVYLSYVEQATIDADASLGFDIARLRDLGGLFVVGQHDIEYLRAAKYGDILDIATWIGEVTPGSILRHYTMRVQGGELSIRAQTRWVWIDLASRKPAEIPADLLEVLARQGVRRET